MKKGIRGHNVAEFGVENICKKCEKQGVSFLQLVMEKSIEGFESGDYTEEYAKSIKRTAWEY